MTSIKRKPTTRTTPKAAKPNTSRRQQADRAAAVAKTERPRLAAAVPPRRQTKKAMVAALLGRAEGASIAELMKATGWQAHSVRATLTGVRKTGQEVARSKDDAGTTRYRLIGTR
jgi:hypothetical protein